MELSIPQIALMSRLLDEALPLDVAGRRIWLETLSPEYQDLAPALRRALLPAEAVAAASKALGTLPKVGSADEASDSAAGELHPGARPGPYELIRPLGAGGMAEVWLARRADGALKREVALKLPALRLRADLEQRFARERDILASLEHSRIARLYDAGIAPDGLPYFAMEYVQGHPLTSWCDAHRLGISVRLELFLQVLEAVQYAHEKRVIHRDLKPSNILVTESGEVRLLDFGVAKLLEAEETDQAPLTGVYGRALTPDYASPELLRGDRLDGRTDVYSLGVVLYELLTGVRPYQLKSAASIGLLDQAIATVEMKKPSTQIQPEAVPARGTTPEKLTRQLRGDLDAIALRALAKEPAERYPSAAALAEDLRRYLEGKPIQAQPARWPYRLRKFVRRNKTVVAVSAAAVVAILGSFGYTLYRETVSQVKVTASAVAALPNAIPEKSIAVLPFVDMSEQKDQEYFSNGLTEELIDLLSQVQELRVPARTSSFAFKGKSEDIASIAQKLRVAHLLEGSVRKSANTIRVTAQLIRADNGYHLWSETYDRDLKDVFKVQDEIAGAVVTVLKLKLEPGQQVSSSHRTPIPEAYTQYLLGQQFLRYYAATPEGGRRALEAYRKAIELDPHYAAAYAALAAFVSDPEFAPFGSNDTAGKLRALATAEKAIELAPDDAEGYGARGFLRCRDSWDWAGAQADLEKALAIDPRLYNAQVAYGWLLGILGRLPESVAATQKGTELDPLSVHAWVNFGARLAANRQFAAAHEAFRRALEIQPDAGGVSWQLASLQLLEGKAAEALAIFRKLDSLRGIAMAEHTLGHAKESQQALDRLITKRAQDAAYSSAYSVAVVYAWRGEKDKAFEWLERAYQHREPPLTGIKSDLPLDSLHADPRYKALLRKMNLPE